MPGSENLMHMFFYVYVLQNRENNLYVGYARDLKKRIKEHNDGLVFSTKHYKPWHLIHYEAYTNQKDARRREKYFKHSQGSRLLKRMLKEHFYEHRDRKN